MNHPLQHNMRPIQVEQFYNPRQVGQVRIKHVILGVAFKARRLLNLRLQAFGNAFGGVPATLALASAKLCRESLRG